MGVTDLAARRWDTNTQPIDHRPSDALKAAQRIIDDDGEPVHIIVAVLRKEGESDYVSWFQAGAETPSGQIGLLARLMRSFNSGEG